jgi:hypothetical protein
MLYPLLNGALGNKGKKDFDSIVRLILFFEDVIIRSGFLPSDFVFMICRPKDHKHRNGESAGAGIAGPSVAPKLHAFVEVCTPTVVGGWAADLDRPDTALTVDIRVNGRPHGTALCDIYRKDVQDAGYGNGRCGFRFHYPPPLRPVPGSSVEVCLGGTQTPLAKATVVFP